MATELQNVRGRGWLLFAGIVLVAAGLIMVINQNRGSLSKSVGSQESVSSPKQIDHFVKKVALRGEHVPSDPIDASGIPARWSYWFYGPSNGVVELTNGQTFSIHSGSIGTNAGPWKFYGSRGDSITVLFLPKGVPPPAIAPRD